MRNKLKGDADDSDLHGGNDRDFIKGGGGNDHLFGNDGRDLIIGNAGDDVIVGGRGDDTLAGGRGADVFVFAAGDGRDVVRGFHVGEDKIALCDVGSASVAEDAFGTTISYDGGTIRLIGVHGFDAADLLTGTGG